MRRGVPLNSVEGRRLVERGPQWREHPDYYRDEPDEDDEPVADPPNQEASRQNVSSSLDTDADSV